MAGDYTTKVSEVKKDSPAYEAGLRPDDTIEKVDGHRIISSSEVGLYINLKKGEAGDIV